MPAFGYLLSSFSSGSSFAGKVGWRNCFISILLLHTSWASNASCYLKALSSSTVLSYYPKVLPAFYDIAVKSYDRFLYPYLAEDKGFSFDR